MTKRTTKLVIFDLDGTLVDSARDLCESANQLVAERGGPPLEENRVVRMVGGGARVLVFRVLVAAGLEFDEAALGRFLEIYEARLLKHTKPYGGIPETLAALRAAAFERAVLTNKPFEPTKAILDGTGLSPYFGDAVVAGDGPWARKPAPDGLRSIVDKAGARGEEALFVGDSRIDLETARAADVPMCLARYGFGAGDLPAQDPPGVEFSVMHPTQLIDRLGLKPTAFFTSL
ncbi:MAG: HAD-IA family hydrolase [Acidobacteria bacterium]|nr:HAD-IA family hydrolase [Acidobacteriota bacterium]